MQKRLALVGGAASLLFFAGSMYVVYRVTDPASPGPGDGPGLAPAPWGTASPAEGAGGGPSSVEPAAAGSAPAPPLQPAPILPPESVPDPVAKPAPAWLEGASRTLGPTRDATALGPLRPYVAAGMGRLQASVAGCADELAASGGGQGQARRGRTVLTLQIETLDAKLRIVDVTLQDQAVASDPRVECASRKLRGQLIPAPCKKGSSFEVPFVLNL